MKRVWRLLFFVAMVLILAKNASTQAAQLTAEEKDVKEGNNPITWKGKPRDNTKTKLKATFETKAPREFIPGSSSAASLYGTAWFLKTDTGQKVEFTSTVTVEGGKVYPTFFQGRMKIQANAQGGNSGVAKKPDPGLVWEATGAFSSVKKPHWYYNVERTKSKFTYGPHEKTKINKDGLAINYRIFDANTGKAHTWGDFIQAVALTSSHLDGFIAHYLPNDKYETNIPVWPETTPKCSCAIKTNPQCKLMCTGLFEISGYYHSAPTIDLPEWQQYNDVNVGDETRAAWDEMMPKIEKHEKEHAGIYNTYYRYHSWWDKYAKEKQEISVCVNDAKLAEQIVEEYLTGWIDNANKEWREMEAKHDRLQKKLDQDEKKAGYPMYKPMINSKRLLTK